MKTTKFARNIIRVRPFAFCAIAAIIAVLEVHLAMDWQTQLRSVTAPAQVQPIVQGETNPWAALAGAR